MTDATPPQRTVWVDVEDFFLYFDANPRPSGIQRLVFETLRAMPACARSYPGRPRIAFVRHAAGDGLLREVSFEDVTRLFDGTHPSPAEPPLEQPPKPKPPGLAPRRPLTLRLRHWMLRRINQLPPAAAAALSEAGVLQLRVFRHARALLAALQQAPQPAPLPAIPAQSPAPGPAERFRGRAGDVFLVLGAPWVHRDYAVLLGRLRDDHRMQAALLLYDLIPLRRPEWCAQVLVQDFAAWLTSTLPLYSRLMAISHATARDVTAYAREIGLPLASPVRTIPIGTGFGLTAAQQRVAGPRPRGLPTPGSYVLFVSTLEARKNHALLFRVWRRLLAEMPPAQVPTLVFAGRVGWLVADLMQQLENVDWFDGKIRLLRDPTDAELAALYQGCQFTVFPSLFEGWGLPVSESLELGCPCVSANGTSLPEVGGDLARYFNPDNIDDAYHTIRAVIEDPAGLEAWRADVKAHVRHVPWDRTANAILGACLEAVAPAETMAEAQ